MATIGNAPVYDADVEPWSHYVECLEQFFFGNRITDNAQKTGIFLSVVGPKTYGVLRSLLSPANPSTKMFEQFKKALKHQFSPRRSKILERYRFNSRVQHEAENISISVAKLRSLSEYCKRHT